MTVGKPYAVSEIHYSFPGRIGVSGIGNIAWQHVRGLVQQGQRVHLHCGTLERPLEGVASLHESFRVLGWRIPYRLLGNDRMFDVHDRVVARRLRRAPAGSMLHCWPLGSLASLRAARRHGIRTVLERPNTHTRFAYDVVAKEVARLGLVLPASHSHAPNAARLAREEAEYAAADVLRCPSEFVARTFLREGFHEAKIAIGHYGYDPEHFRPAPEEQQGGGGLKAVFVASGEPRKGLHFALEAWVKSEAARDGRFEIYGRFIPEYRNSLVALLKHPSVHEMGFTSDVAAAMQRADVLILPSVEEGSALVTYEARACGCVLVVSDATGAPCDHMQNGLVHAAGDVAAVQEHVSLLHRDRGLLARLREASLGGIAKLTWDEAAARLVGTYREATEK